MPRHLGTRWRKAPRLLVFGGGNKPNSAACSAAPPRPPRQLCTRLPGGRDCDLAVTPPPVVRKYQLEQYYKFLGTLGIRMKTVSGGVWGAQSLGTQAQSRDWQ
ncbi:hypothetical protein NDU88_008684 [Pleurodeles waltl]|uniref:Uncharacterized protein n=1 Tax=Pleurodeles waltl TaxID=8319 RepID=A0AAV7NAF6_PLEWA|nr:hypothetical protein NDU88_008684 [Pleurodeles waltl]